MPKETLAGLKQENASLKEQISALADEVRLMKDKTNVAATPFHTVSSTENAPRIEAEKSLQFISDEYNDMDASNTGMASQLQVITRRLNELSIQVDRMSSAIAQAEEYSYLFNVKIIGLPELKDNESAQETSDLCVKLFKEMGAEVALSDIDIAHRVPTRSERAAGTKPVIYKFVRRLAKSEVMVVRQQASQINPTRIGLLDGSQVNGERILDHLTPQSKSCTSKPRSLKRSIDTAFAGSRTLQSI